MDKFRTKEKYDYLKEYNLKPIKILNSKEEIESENLLYYNKKLIAEYFENYNIKNNYIQKIQ